eukprot:TRINITY_DN6636_c0_g1_i1.p1 TRINITY_DN6636_c0_g1~~TRINITY_DN6636_c0_g1_i1.p1  ORF type:complete len:207 (-),score=38.24 TRINITY_DN6636_c0_g1_i1:8-628(-)
MDIENLIQAALVLPAIIIGKAVDFNVGDRKFYVVVTWVVVNVLQVLALLYIWRQIQKKNDHNTITVTQTRSMISLNARKSNREAMTIKAYDEKEWGTLALTVIGGAVVLFYFYWKMDTVVPIFTQLLVGPFRTVRSKLFRLHVLDQHGPDLERPFKSSSGSFSKMLKDMKQEMGLSSGPSKRKKQPKKPTQALKDKLKANIQNRKN